MTWWGGQVLKLNINRKSAAVGNDSCRPRADSGRLGPMGKDKERGQNFIS